MEFFKIEWRRSTKKDLRRIRPDEVEKIVNAVNDLATDPRPQGCVKLTGSDCAYRLRVGEYRILYEVYDGRLIIEVIKVGHRRDVYR